jgi:16S rRNA (uracil1498-N3)-methyltransferase
MPTVQPAAQPPTVVVGGDEARHALRVKRLITGDQVLLASGAGILAPATITSTRKLGKDGWELSAQLASAPFVHPRPSPSVHLCAAFPKGDLLEHMLDQLSQCGIDSVSMLRTQRAFEDDRPPKRERLNRICEESLKQCCRPWLMQLADPLDLALALRHDGPVLVADASGDTWPTAAQHLAAHQPIRILVGPEGGFTPDELALARDARATIVRATPHILRIETAAVALASLVLSTLAPPSSSRSTVRA